jgi:hypothetical protein
MDVFIPVTLPSLVAALASSGPVWGKAAFIGVFVLLLIWLLAMPARLIGNDRGTVPWWRNARVWAIGVVIVQILMYLGLG